MSNLDYEKEEYLEELEEVDIEDSDYKVCTYCGSILDEPYVEFNDNVFCDGICVHSYVDEDMIQGIEDIECSFCHSSIHDLSEACEYDGEYFCDTTCLDAYVEDNIEEID